MLDRIRDWLRDNSVKTVNENQATALHLAASSFRIEVAKLLLEHGAGCKNAYIYIRIIALYNYDLTKVCSPSCQV